MELVGFFGTSIAFAILFRFLSMRNKEYLFLSKKAVAIKAFIQCIYSAPGLYLLFHCYQELQYEFWHEMPEEVKNLEKKKNYEKKVKN